MRICFAAFCRMRLGIDNDFFCKLGCSGALDAFLALLSLDDASCFVLASLVAQLKSGRGKLFKKYAAVAKQLLLKAETLGRVPEPKPTTADQFLSLEGVDPGEAQLLGFALENADVTLATGDKRCIRALKDVPAVTAQLRGRIICVERAFRLLCERHSVEATRSLASPCSAFDIAISNCFSPAADGQVLFGLDSELGHLAKNTEPSILWVPPGT